MAYDAGGKQCAKTPCTKTAKPIMRANKTENIKGAAKQKN